MGAKIKLSLAFISCLFMLFCLSADAKQWSVNKDSVKIENACIDTSNAYFHNTISKQNTDSKEWQKQTKDVEFSEKQLKPTKKSNHNYSWLEKLFA